MVPDPHQSNTCRLSAPGRCQATLSQTVAGAIVTGRRSITIDTCAVAPTTTFVEAVVRVTAEQEVYTRKDDAPVRLTGEIRGRPLVGQEMRDGANKPGNLRTFWWSKSVTSGHDGPCTQVISVDWDLRQRPMMGRNQVSPAQPGSDSQGWVITKRFVSTTVSLSVAASAVDPVSKAQ